MIEELQNQVMLREIIEEYATDIKVARRIVRKTAIPQKVEAVNQTAQGAATTAGAAQTAAAQAEAIAQQAAADAAAAIAANPVNDSVAPSIPSGVTATVFEDNLSITWDAPPASEYVETTMVRITPQGGSASTFQTKDRYRIVPNLAVGVVHTIEVQHTDRWGLSSGWSSGITRTPLPTIADQIANSVTIAAANITGQLGNSQLAQITDATKLSEAVYQTAVDKAGRFSNLLPFREAEATAYPVGSWPGTSGVPANAGTGRTLSVVALGSDNWWQIATTTANIWSQLVNRWTNYNLVGTQDYLYSCHVRNGSGASAQVQVRMESSATSAGGTPTVVDSGTITVPNDGRLYRVFVKFTHDATKNFIRFSIANNTANTTIQVNKFMLEQAATGQNSPGQYVMPIMETGALSARLLTAWDAAAVNLVVGNGVIDAAKITDATILTAKIADAQITAAKILDLNVTTAKIADLNVTSGKIASLAADKITAGTISAHTITLATSGKLQSAGAETVFGAAGISLTPGAKFDAPSTSVANKISASTWAALHFWQDTLTAGIDWRGATLRSDGNIAGGWDGAVTILATKDGSAAAATTASIDVYTQTSSMPGSTGGWVDIKGTFRSLNQSVIEPTDYIPTTTILTGVTASFTHNYGKYPTVMQLYGIYSGGGDEPLPGYHWGGSGIYAYNLTTNGFQVKNGYTFSANLVGRLLK